MSGRAGRRGKDENGIVIMMVDEKLSPSVGKALVKVNICFDKILTFKCYLSLTILIVFKIHYSILSDYNVL